MRIVAVAALGYAVGFAIPCAAQTEQAELPQTSIVAKQSHPASPQLLAPPETSLPQPNAPVITHGAPLQAKQTYTPAPAHLLASPEPVEEPQQSEAAFSTPERLVEWVY